MRMTSRCVLFLLCIFPALGFSWPFDTLFSHQVNLPLGASAWVQKEMHMIQSRAGIDSKALKFSLIAYLNAQKRGYADNKKLLTVIDYSKPSSEKRLWVFDLNNGRTLFNTWVSHGKNSGGAAAYSFSNSMGSLKSSLGVFLTESTYVGGRVGYALRLRGLEHGINDNAYNRAVVIHGARYVNGDVARSRGQVGRSWGCPAVTTSLARPLINTIKNRTVLVAYYPDRNWLSHSRFLNA